MSMYKTIILLLATYGCETWSLILREEFRLRAFENRILRGEYLDPKGMKLGNRESYTMRDVIVLN